MSSIYLQNEYETVSCGADGCAQHFAMSAEFYRQTQRTGEVWYCPSGHRRVWRGQTTEARLEAAKARERHLEDQLRASVEDAERSRQALARDRHRFANGICPCCIRLFVNVARHMSSQHPDFDPGPLRARTTGFECSCGETFETYRGLRIHQGWRRSADWQTSTWAWDQHLTVVAP